MRSRIYHCVTSRKLRGKHREQNMADLPEVRSMQHLSHMLAWICLGPLSLKKVERS